MLLVEICSVGGFVDCCWSSSSSASSSSCSSSAHASSCSFFCCSLLFFLLLLLLLSVLFCVPVNYCSCSSRGFFPFVCMILLLLVMRSRTIGRRCRCRLSTCQQLAVCCSDYLAVSPHFFVCPMAPLMTMIINLLFAAGSNHKHTNNCCNCCFSARQKYDQWMLHKKAQPNN